MAENDTPELSSKDAEEFAFEQWFGGLIRLADEFAADTHGEPLPCNALPLIHHALKPVYGFFTDIHAMRVLMQNSQRTVFDAALAENTVFDAALAKNIKRARRQRAKIADGPPSPTAQQVMSAAVELKAMKGEECARKLIADVCASCGFSEPHNLKCLLNSPPGGSASSWRTFLREVARELSKP